MAYNPPTLIPGYTLWNDEFSRTNGSGCKLEFTWWLPAPAVKRWARRTSLQRRAAARCQTCPAAS